MELASSQFYEYASPMARLLILLYPVYQRIYAGYFQKIMRSYDSEICY